jgi:hypothetical protein
MLRWGNIVRLAGKFLYVGKLTTLISPSLLTSCELSYPFDGLKTSFLLTFALKSSKKILCHTLGCDQIHNPVPHRSCPLRHHSYPHMGRAHSEQYSTSHLFIHDILSLINSTLLTPGMILLCTKSLSLPDDPHSLLHRKMYNPLPVQCHPSPIRPPVHPLSLNLYFRNSLAADFIEPVL